MSAWTSARDGHVQTSPLLNAKSTRPSTALFRNASSWAMTSWKKMFGLLPPSSAVTGMMFSAAYCIISRPVVVSPVNPIFAIRGLVASALPIEAPGPVRTLITPAGTASPMISMSLRIDHGVDLGARALPRAGRGGDVAEVVGRERDVGRRGCGQGRSTLASAPSVGCASDAVRPASCTVQDAGLPLNPRAQMTMPSSSTSTRPATEMTVSITDQLRIVSPTVMPKYSLTSQKPASLTWLKNSDPEPMASTSSDV